LLAREGAKARLWQLETETNDLLRAFPDLRNGQHSQTTSQGGSRLTDRRSNLVLIAEPYRLIMAE